tara:strand:+ start:115 stop:870 length:756 start_codon:yes stop_codon:yes gene_type:complete
MLIAGARWLLTTAVKQGLKTKYGAKKAAELVSKLQKNDNVPKNVQNFITRTFTKSGKLANIAAPTPVRSGVPRATAIKESALAREVAANARKTQSKLITTGEIAGTTAVALQRDKKPADTSAFAKAKAAAAVKAAERKNKPKPPFRNTNSRTTKALNQGLSAPPKSKFDPKGIKERLASRKSGKLKTSLRAARAAGDLYYKNSKTGRKMAAVLDSDLKPGQTLTDYINKKEGKTAKIRRPRRKPTQKPKGL